MWKRFRKETAKKTAPSEYKEKCKPLDVLIILFLLGYFDLPNADETAFSLQTNIPYGWVRKGGQRGIKNRKGDNLNVFGLMNILGELTTYQTVALQNF